MVRITFWHRHQRILEKSGYLLRAKYRKGYDPADGDLDENKATHPRAAIMDAVRISDGSHVILKTVSFRDHPDEVNLCILFSEKLARDPRNHCVQILEVLRSPLDPDIHIIVMPQLRRFDDLPFDTVGEFVDAFRQIFEGVEFMHKHRIAHGDLTLQNLMLDASDLFPSGFHPVNTRRDLTFHHYAKYITRTECWPRYYVIDLGMSRRYSKHKAPCEISTPVSFPFVHLLPERKGAVSRLFNPFPVDVFHLGHILRKEFHVYEHRPLAFLRPLVDSMLSEDAALRPTMSEVVQTFGELCRGLSPSHLQLPGSPGIDTLCHRVRQKLRAFKHIPPIPYSEFAPKPPLIDAKLRPYYTSLY
ncbi:kinase-like domain-containing protein [Mucidula mucida]|nr:kinase-like domain-containing protein [Mucidula mucida]